VQTSPLSPRLRIGLGIAAFGAPAEVQQLVAVFVVISAIAVALMLAPERRRTTIEARG
jgi:hypothetical protein